jgi:DNA (cytosine-5)-methyltransferase 1
MAGSGGGADDNTAQGGHLVAATLTSRPGKGPGSDLPDGHVVPVGVYQGHGTNVGPMGTLRAGSGTVTGGVPFTLGGQGMRDLTAEGADASEDGTGRGTPLVPIGFNEALGNAAYEDVSPSIRTGTGGASTSVTVPTLTAAMGSNNGAPGDGGEDQIVQAVAAAHASVRRLTPTECERLQGYPDGWTATSYGRVQADAPRYRQLGNSIAVPVFEWVAGRMVAVDQGSPL